MRTLAMAVVLGAVLAVGLFGHVRPALACSGQPDRLNDPDVIVGGRFSGWSPAPGADATADQYLVDIGMLVDRAYKGRVTGEITLVETLLFRRKMHDGSYGWMGGTAACGAFETDPTGKYGILGLKAAGDGTYKASSLLRFFIGPEPEGEAYDRAMQLLAPLAPDTGSAGPVATGARAGEAHGWLLPMAAAVAPLYAAVTIGLAARRYRRRPISG